MNNFKFYDISIFIQEDKDNYTKTVPIIPIGKELFNGLHIELNGHYGTHVDAPYHLIPNKKKVHEYPLERFIIPAVVVESFDTDSVKVADLENIDYTSGCAVLLKTENSRSGKSKTLPFRGSHVCLEPEALQYLIDKNVTLIGFDAPHGERDAEDNENQLATIHEMMFNHDCLILESINLSEVNPGEYILAVLPIKLRDVSGCPARAILIEKEK